MKKIILVVLCLAFGLSLTACGGGGDALKGTWVGTSDSYGEVTWDFNGGGKCTFACMATEGIDPWGGTYKIVDDENVIISMWDADNPYTYSVTEDTLVLTSTDGLAPSITMTRK